MKNVFRLLCVLNLVFICSAISFSNDVDISVQLKYYHQFQFAGFYMALEKGYYSNAGLNVELFEGGPDIDVNRAVLNGEADFGVSATSLIIQRALGEPVVAVAAIFQHSPQVIITLKDSGIDNPHMLIGKKVLLSENDYLNLAMILNEGISESQLEIEEYNYQVGQLISGEADAIGAYSTWEPFLLEASNVQYYEINPRTYGIDFYGDMLFSTEEYIHKNPKAVRAFRAATIQGWLYAMNHIDETVNVIINNYNPGISEDALRFEAETMGDLILPSLIDFGYINPGRIEHIAETFEMMGLIDDGFQLDDFIYDVNKSEASVLLRKLMIALLGVIIMGVGIVLSLSIFNSQLKEEVVSRDLEIETSNAKIKKEAELRKEIENELDVIEKRYRIIVETNDTGYVFVNEKGIVIEANYNFIKLVGKDKAEDVVGHNVLEWTVDSDYDKNIDLLKECLHDGKVKDRELYYVHQDGKRVPVSFNARVIKTDEGKGVIALIRDISHWKDAQKKILRLSERYHNILETVPDIIIETDNEKKCVWTNDAGIKFFGGDVVGKKEDVYKVETEHTLNLSLGFKSSSDKFYLERWYKRKDGEVRLIAWWGSSNFDDNKEKTGMIYSGRDITEWFEVEKELISSEEKFSRIIQNSPLGIHLYKLTENDGLVFVGANPGADRLLGVDNKQFIGMKMEEAFPMLKGTEISINYKKVAKSGGNYYAEKVDYKDEIIKGAYEIYVFQTNQNMIAVLFLDITQRKKDEAEKEKLYSLLDIKNQELEQIIYVTSHDLRSPLVNVQGFSSEMYNSVRNLRRILSKLELSDDIKTDLDFIINDDIPESLNYILSSVEKMDSLLTGLLNLSRVGRKDLKLDKISMNDIINKILSTLKYNLIKNGIEVKINDLPDFVGDEDQMNQVFTNIIENAIKYRKAGRKAVINISGELSKGQVVYCFEDNGIGIDEAYQEKVFEVFHRLNPRETEGLGMGMSIAKKIVNRHSGKIWFESDGLSGTKFFVSLPLPE